MTFKTPIISFRFLYTLWFTSVLSNITIHEYVWSASLVIYVSQKYKYPIYCVLQQMHQILKKSRQHNLVLFTRHQTALWNERPLDVSMIVLDVTSVTKVTIESVSCSLDMELESIHTTIEEICGKSCPMYHVQNMFRLGGDVFKLSIFQKV